MSLTKGPLDKVFSLPPVPHITLISEFASQISLLRLFCDSSLFSLPRDNSNMLERITTGIVRESAHSGERKKEEEKTKPTEKTTLRLQGLIETNLMKQKLAQQLIKK